MVDFNPSRLQLFQKFSKVFRLFFQGSIDSPSQPFLVGRLFLTSHPGAVMVPAGLRILYNGKPMLQAQLVIHAPDRPGRAPEVAEFFLTVQRSRVYDNVIMDMVFIHMGADNKSMVSLRQL